MPGAFLKNPPYYLLRWTGFRIFGSNYLFIEMDRYIQIRDKVENDIRAKKLESVQELITQTKDTEKNIISSILVHIAAKHGQYEVQ
jgi:hypothetical protein